MSTRILISSLALCAMMGACERRADKPVSSTDARPVDAAPAAPAADNTAKNKVDRVEPTKTPMDQSNSKSDIDITAAIRRSIMEDKSMSMNAQNCKIITEAGVTTLRGPVASQAEKDAIGAKASAVAGVTRVDNQLEVKVK
ncbi:MAG: BON domain-containing protein [Phycisphaerales bacterium]|nr:BON domain-containing protein [Phycisphaerales bacterium]